MRVSQQEQLRIIPAAEEICSRADSRKHDMDKSCICDWLKKEPFCQNSEYIYGDRRSFRGPKSGAHPELKTLLHRIIEERRSRVHTVLTEMAQIEILKLAR